MSDQTTTQELYGSNAVTGSADDALKGRDVEIKSSTTTTFSTKTEEEVLSSNQEGDQEASKEGDKETEVDKQQQEELNPEQQLEQEIKQQIEAEEEIKKDLDSKGVNFDALAKEYEANGTLSESTFEQLAKAGYPKSVVDAYIAGLEATSAKFEQQVLGFAGGKEEFSKMTDFVKSLGQPYVNAFNKTIESGDMTQIKVAIEGFKAQMTAKHGTSKRTIMGKGEATTGVTGFSSKAEMIKAMSDPRYGRDTKYTKEVEAKTLRTNF